MNEYFGTAQACAAVVAGPILVVCACGGSARRARHGSLAGHCRHGRSGSECFRQLPL